MKILFVTCSAHPLHFSGVATLISNISAELKKRGHQIYVFTYDTNLEDKMFTVKRFETDNYHLYSITLHDTSLRNFVNCFKDTDYINYSVEPYFLNYLREIEPDLVHFHSLQGLGANIITLAKKENYKTILTMHDWWWICPTYFLADVYGNPCNQVVIDIKKCQFCLKRVSELDMVKNVFRLEPISFLRRRDSYLRRVLAEDLDILLPVSNYLKNYLETNGILAKKVIVNENGVNKPETIKIKNIDPNKIKFGYFGGFNNIKGHSILMDTFKKVEKENWELHVYGHMPTSTYSLFRKMILSLKNKMSYKIIFYLIKNKIINGIKEKKQLRGNNLDKIKFFPPFSESEKYEIINSIDILFVVSIVQESFSLVTREALINKTPVIASECGGPLEIIKNGVNGLVVKMNDWESLFEAVNKILDEPNLIEKMVQNIDPLLIRTIDDQVNQLEHLYT